jgi:cytidylate kinase
MEPLASVHLRGCSCISREMHESAVRIADAVHGPSGRPDFVLAIDGSSGAGKTTLAACIAAQSGASVFHMDDIYPGWSGLEQGAQYLVDWILRPLAESRPAIWRRYDWYTEEFAETHAINPGGPLIVEGVGSYSLQSAPYLHSTIWVEASTPQRRARVESRDGLSTAQMWPLWAAQEETFHRKHRTREAADFLIQN